MELLDITDENGNLTGEVMERKKAHDLNLLHWEIAVIVINKNKQILLQRRSPNKRFDPNKWGLCAGHVESGESLEHAAQREIEEELGIKINELKILDEMDVKKRETNSHITRTYYIIHNENDFEIQEEELSEVKWFNIGEVIKMIKEKDETLVLKDGWLRILEKLKQI